MSATDEETYLQLHAKFQEELTLVEQQIIDLQDRRDQLTSLLSGAGPATVVFTPEEEPEPIHRRKEKTENNRVAKSKCDTDLVSFVINNPGASRADIKQGLAPQWSTWDVDKSLTRVSRAGTIVRKGNTRSATWHPKEQV